MLTYASQDNILMAIVGQGIAPEDGEDNAGEGSSAQAGHVLYVLHPNCAVEEV
jgi:DNA replication licensing factor MCM6